MSKYGFLSVLEEELDKHLEYDFAIDWDKKNHAVEVVVVLEAQNRSGVETVDDKGEMSAEDIVFEDTVLFYNPAKSHFDGSDYLVAIPYEPKKGFSREFLAYFADFLNDVVTDGLSDLMDFLADEEAEEFSMTWNQEVFENGRADLEEGAFYPYPRY